MSPILGSVGAMSHDAYRGNLDDYADDFFFQNINNAEPGVTYISGITTITGINNKIKVTVGTGGSFSVNGDAFSTSPKFIRSGDELELSLTTTQVGLATDFSKLNNLFITIGKRNTTWTVATRPKNDNLTPFIFNSITNLPVGVSTNSNTITISGLEPGYSVPISVSQFDARISINGGPLVSSGNVFNGNTFYIDSPALPVASQSSYSQTRTMFVFAGDYLTTWTVTTQDADLTPDPFTFNNISNVEINTTYTSNSVTVSGINGATNPKFTIPISVLGTGFQYNKNGGTFTSEPGSAVLGDVITLRTTPSNYSTSFTGTLLLGTLSANWTITTRSQPFDTVPNVFVFNSLTGASLNTTFISNEIVLSGMTAGFDANAFISSGEFRVVRNGTVIRDYSSSSTNVQLGDKITLRNTSSSNYNTTRSTTFSVSGIELNESPGTTSASWNIITESAPVVAPTPTVTLNASSTNIQQGSSTTLTWSSTNATSVSSSNFGATAVSGSLIVSPTTTTTYNIIVSGSGGTATATRLITVFAAPPPPSTPTVTLNASSTNIQQGSSTTLSWSSSNATSVSSSNFGATTVSGSAVVSPTSSTTFTITVSGPGGTATATRPITINVSQSISLSPSDSFYSTNSWTPGTIFTSPSLPLFTLTCTAGSGTISIVDRIPSISGSVSLSPSSVFLSSGQSVSVSGVFASPVLPNNPTASYVKFIRCTSSSGQVVDHTLQFGFTLRS